MAKNMLEQIKKYLIEYRKQKRWKKIVSVMMALVVFVTTYALILPAITMEIETNCGLQEHIHTEECYEATFETKTELICNLPEIEDHIHDETCYETEKVLVCELTEEEIGHVYIGEDTEDVHIEEETEEAGHVHTEDCYEEKEVLACDQEELEGHTHTEECYTTIEIEIETEEDQDQELVCDLEEHEHTEECYLEENPDEYILTATTLEGITVVLEGPRNSFAQDLDELSLTAKELDPDVGGGPLLDETADEEAFRLEEEGRIAAAFENLDTAIEGEGLVAESKRLFDIRLWHGEEEVEPIGSVTVTFSDIENPDKAEIKVYHTDDEEDIVTDMEAIQDRDGNIILDTDHFSIYAIAIMAEEIIPVAVGTINAGIELANVTWDTTTKKISQLSFKATNTTKDWFYTLQHSTNGGTTWTPPNPTDTETGTKSGSNNAEINFNPVLMNDLTLNSVFRVYGYMRNKANEHGYTSDLTIPEILDTVKAGFSTWLENNYTRDFGGTTPTDINGLYTAFDMYYKQPVTKLTQELRDGKLWLDVSLNPKPEDYEAYQYHWFYKDDDGQWQELTGERTSSINATELQTSLKGGKEVVVKVYDGDRLVSISNQLLVDPQAQAYSAAIKAINEGLGLASYPIGNNKTADLTIGGKQFNDLFYYENVKNDRRVPFEDAKTYSDYLAETYLLEGIEAVRTVWNRYLYDLYDPSLDKGAKTNFTDYPGAATYGDGTYNWPKDSGGVNSDPFQVKPVPVVKPLDYGFLEDGVDYSNFVTGLHKTAKALAPGDVNEERRYNIEIIADAQAKVKAPVALIFQIQTSWQMFDLGHANRLKTDLPVNGTNVGAASYNTEMANLYDIKNALLRLVDYVDENIPGNNLVMAISDVEHAGTFNMFTGTDGLGKPLHVTNDANKLRQGIIGWDTFGNCEHIHYDSGALVQAVNNLASNLSGWQDVYGKTLSYENIKKSAVIIGGPTENSNGTSGYGITLPWATFQNAKLNSVYGVRVNEGRPVATNTSGIISWIDFSRNNAGPSFKDGTGTSFTDKYVASNEDALFNALLDIVMREMNSKGIDVEGEIPFVENVTVKDTVTEEFFLNKNANITASILSKEGTVEKTVVLSLEGATIEHIDGVITTTKDGLVIKEEPYGRTTIEYTFDKVHNTKKAVLNFQVEARETYIGSNTVFTNVGTPDLDYQHIKKDANGDPTGVVDSYDVKTKDTPQVNVPIRFNTVDGDTVSIIVGETVDLKDLSEAIVEDAEDRVDNYPQTNGTLSYIWVLPDGSEVSAGSVKVIGGSIGAASFPNRSHTFTGLVPGNYPATLKVTFTPENVDSANKNFSDEATKAPVNPLTKPGNVWINVVDVGSKTDLIVRKDWAGGSPGAESVSFHLLANGDAVLGEDGNRVEYTLNVANEWKIRIPDLPLVRNNAGKTEVITYTVVEDPIPEGYTVYYSEEGHTDTTYAAKATLYFAFKDKQDDKKDIRITYRYGGEEREKKIEAIKGVSYESNTVYSTEVLDLPLDNNGKPYTDIEITSVLVGEKKHNSTNVTIPKPTAEPYKTGTIKIPVLVISNVISYELPETGGPGTIPYMMAGILLLGTSLIYIINKFRKGGYKTTNS